jgi:hypothetical protein
MTSRSTTSDAVDSLAVLRRGRAGRRVAAVILRLFAIAAAVGFFGVRSESVSARQRALAAHVTFPRISRPGEPANWTLDVRRPGGFAGDITVTTTASYLAVFDQNDLHPQPDDTQISGDQVTWTFSRPDGEEFQIGLDGNIDSNTLLGRHRGTTVVETSGERVAVSYTTWTAP